MKARFKTTSAASPQRRVVELAKGDYVFEQGDLGTEMYVIHEGAIEIMNTDIDPRPIAVLEKGDFFGEMAILEGAARTASARAAVDSKLVQINEATFSRLLRKDPEVAIRIMRKLSQRVRRLEELLLERGAPVPPASEVTDAGQTGALSPAGQEEEPRASVAVAGGPRLVHPGTGVVFNLMREETSLVGRRDPITGIKPTVDLTPIDPERSCSRQHARIYPEGDAYFLAEDISTTNGTFLNEDRLGTGVPARMASGDRVRFGLVTLEFTA
ncbi:MAG: cyclic nucleotide-binding domain-containing protein [bacterium]|nr:cyclic nucleotide-binding domain-containing protein [bacterium]